MERPVHLRDDAWYFMLDKAESYSEEELWDIARKYGYEGKDKESLIQNIVDKPAAFLFEIGILEHPHFLKQTVVALEGDVEYIIDEAAAKQIGIGDRIIYLTRLFDKQKLAIVRDNIIEAFRRNCEFDQLELAGCA
jgi:hypothetical protein